MCDGVRGAGEGLNQDEMLQHCCKDLGQFILFIKNLVKGEV